MLAGHARYGRGKVAFLGDSSPCDDGTGNTANPNISLANSYTADLSGAHRILLVNTTVWLAAQDSSSTSVTLSVSASGSTTICAGDSIRLTASGATSYSWSPGGATTASITVSPASTSTYSVTGMVNSIAQTQTITITVNDLPVPAFTSSTTGMDVSFTSQAQNATTVTWNFGDGSAQDVSSTPVHIYQQNGTYTVLLIASNGCGADTISKQITINVNGISTIDPSNTVMIYQLNQDQIKVVYPSQYTLDRDIFIYNIMGQQIQVYSMDYEQTSRLVNIKNLTSGLYFMKVGNTIKKFIR